MFGHDWEPAEGTIIDERVQGGNRVNGVTDQRFLVEVRPRDGETFRVEIGLPRLSADFILRPGPGQVVKLQVDVKRRKARFDTSDPDESNRALAKRDKARVAAELAGPPEPAQVASEVSPADILATGAPVRVAVVKSSALRKTDQAGFDMYALSLEVQHGGQEPTPITIWSPVPPDCLPLLNPGDSLPAKVLADPNALAIDWHEARAALP